LGEFLGGYWTAEIVALSFVTVLGLKKLEFLLCFHAFRNDAQLQAFAHADHRRDDGNLARNRGPILIHDHHGIRRGFQQAVVSRLHLHEVPISYGIGWEGHNRECIAGVRCGRHNRRDRWFHSVSKEGELCKTVTVQFLAQARLRLCKIEHRTNMCCIEYL
jgi:hypothetical protein